MHRLLCLAAAMGAVRAGDAPGEWAKDDAVVHLGDNDWDRFRETNPKMLAMFYAPWCGHCKTLKPDYGEASADTQFRMPMVAVDCTEQKATCDKFKVQGYPTLKYFDTSTDDGSDYGGGRSKGDLVKFIEEKAGPDDSLLKDADLTKLRIKQLKQIIHDRGEECTGCSEKADFVKMAQSLVDKPKTGPKAKKKSTKSTLVNGRSFMQQRRYDEAKKVANEGWEEGSGEVVHLVEDEWDTFMEQNPKVIAMFYAPWCGHCKKFKPEFTTASKELKGQPLKLVAVECETNKELCRKQGATGYPTIKYYDLTSGDVKVAKKGESFRGSRDAEGLIGFAKRKVAGDSDAYGPYENKPLWEENGNVYHVGDLHWKEFKASHPTMLVMFYAPWCGHCKAFKPGYAEASERLKEREAEVVLVAVDCTTEVDLCQKFGVTGYPDIKWFSGSGKPKAFDGGRTADDTVAWVEGKLAAKDSGSAGEAEAEKSKPKGDGIDHDEL